MRGWGWLLWVMACSLAMSVCFGQGKHRAVVVGVAGYRHGYVALDYSGDDARRVGSALRKLGYAVHVLAADADAGLVRAEDVKRAIEDASKKSEAGDTLLFFFAGHGSRRQDKDYLLFSDSDPDHFATTALSLETLGRLLDGCKATQRVFVIDACRNTSKRAEGTSGFEDGRLNKAFKERLDAVLRTEDTSSPVVNAILYACSPGETSRESDLEKAGLFTQQFVQALETGASGTQSLTLGSVLDYIRTHLPAELQTPEKQQTPILSGPITLELRPATRGNSGSDTPMASGPMASRIKINAKDNAEMVWIPKGPFLMGDDDQSDNPRKKVSLDGYYLYKNPVTVSQYEQFCDATGRKMPDPPSFNPNWSKKDHPIVNVSWEDASAYCHWAGGRLPTEAEWEKAARGTEGQKFPWADTYDNSRLWHSRETFGDAGGTAPVGSFPRGASPYGVLDMAGNVYQWCADWYDTDSSKSVPMRTPIGPRIGSQGNKHVLRGGSWYNYDPGLFRASVRRKGVPTLRGNNLGFRCASYL